MFNACVCAQARYAYNQRNSIVQYVLYPTSTILQDK